jgi:hypothetical protein
VEKRSSWEKATALAAALRVAPSGPDRERVLGRLVAFLGSSSFQRESVLEWYGQVQRTASSVRDLGLEATARFLGELERSGNPILNLYAVAARVIPNSKN